MKTNLNLVSYDCAKFLKEIGFDYECLYHYNEYNEPIRNENYEDNNANENGISCPDNKIVRQWFRDSLGVDTFVARLSNVTIPNLGYGFVIFYKQDTPDAQTYPYETFEEAEAALVMYVLNIIKNERNGKPYENKNTNEKLHD